MAALTTSFRHFCHCVTVYSIPPPCSFLAPETSREFTLSELKSATNSWSNVIGKGGYGTVYKAELKDSTVVAVKRLDQVCHRGALGYCDTVTGTAPRLGTKVAALCFIAQQRPDAS